MRCFFVINEPKFDRVMTFSPHKGMDLANICITKWSIFGKYSNDCNALRVQPKLFKENLLLVYTNNGNCKGKLVDYLHRQ